MFHHDINQKYYLYKMKIRSVWNDTMTEHKKIGSFY
jgi:hypothetical protein